MDFLLDFILHIDQYMVMIVRDYHAWTYAILFFIIFCETGLVVTPFLPGDSLLFVAGAISALPDMPISVHILVIILFAAAVLGDSCNYMIGHFFGRKLSNPNSRIFKQSHLEKTHEFYKKYGGKTIILARFVPIVRTFAPFVAGMGKMNYYYFMMYNLAGRHILLRRLFLRRPSVCTRELETADRCHHIHLYIACNHRGSTSQTKVLKRQTIICIHLLLI